MVMCRVILALCVFWVHAAVAEEVLAPRGKEAYEAHLKELEAKYGARDDAGLRAEVDAATRPVAIAQPVPQSEPVASSPGSAPVSASASLKPAVSVSGRPGVQVPAGARLRIALTPLGADRFGFDGESLDRGALEVALTGLAQTYAIDTLVLLETETPIQALHLVELSRLSAHFKIPALYQRGQTLLAVSAATR